MALPWLRDASPRRVDARRRRTAAPGAAGDDDCGGAVCADRRGRRRSGARRPGRARPGRAAAARRVAVVLRALRHPPDCGVRDVRHRRRQRGTHHEPRARRRAEPRGDDPTGRAPTAVARRPLQRVLLADPPPRAAAGPRRPLPEGAGALSRRPQRVPRPARAGAARLLAPSGQAAAPRPGADAPDRHQPEPEPGPHAARRRSRHEERVGRPRVAGIHEPLRRDAEPPRRLGGVGGVGPLADPPAALHEDPPGDVSRVDAAVGRRHGQPLAA